MASDWFNSRKAMLSLVAMFLAAVTAQAINTGCPVNCGSVPIPYPFGTEKGCYLSQDFKISCRSETPFLTRSHPQLEIKRISIDSHEMTVYTGMSESCYDQQGLINSSVIKTSFSSPSFPFSSTRNKFSAVGCDTLAFFEGDKFITGCFSYCYDSSSVDNSSCSGAGCCQNTNMTSGLHNYNISTSSPLEHHDSWEFNRCDYAFFGEDDSCVFQGMRDFQELGKRKNVPTVLDWAIRDHNCSMAKTHAASYACKGKYTTCMDSQNGAAYYCQCYPGFQGNPYIINGCQDICKHQTCKSRVIKLASILSAVLLITIITGVIVLWRYVSKKRTEERRERF